MKLKKPIVGKDIYIPTALYIDHGQDDFAGGLCQIKSVKFSMQADDWVVEVAERPGHSYYWKYISERQAEWKKRYGKTRGRPDPDNG